MPGDQKQSPCKGYLPIGGNNASRVTPHSLCSATMSTQISKHPKNVMVTCKGASTLLSKCQSELVIVFTMGLLYSIDANTISWMTRKGWCGMSNTNMATGKKSKGAGCLRWLGSVALGAMILLLVLATIGAIYQGIASARDAKLYKPVDQMVDVNGIQMRLDCRGVGSPTVVLEAGAQSPSVIWVRVQDDVAKFTRVCSYDRAGYGWSDPVHETLYPEQVADMLHTLLEKAGEEPPYLMVGHSIGGIYVRAFTEKCPDEVVGMVLVDASHENQSKQTPPEIANLFDPKLLKAASWINQGLVSIGAMRAFKLLDASNISLMLNEDERGPALAELYRTSYISATVREGEMMNAYFSHPRKLKGLGDIPLIVLSQQTDAQKLYDNYLELYPTLQSQLTVEMFQEPAEIYNAQQDELATLSTRGKRIIVAETGHFIQFDKPEVVIDAIQEVSEQVSR